MQCDAPVGEVEPLAEDRQPPAQQLELTRGDRGHGRPADANRSAKLGVEATPPQKDAPGRRDAKIERDIRAGPAAARAVEEAGIEPRSTFRACLSDMPDLGNGSGPANPGFRHAQLDNTQADLARQTQALRQCTAERQAKLLDGDVVEGRVDDAAPVEANVKGRGQAGIGEHHLTADGKRASRAERPGQVQARRAA